MCHPLHNQWTWPLKLFFPFASLPCSSDSRTNELGGLPTSAGNAEAITPAATSISYPNGFIAPYRIPKRGISTSWQHQEESPCLAVDPDSLLGSPPPAPNQGDQGNFMPCFPHKSCPAELSKPTHSFFLVPVSVHDAAQEGFFSLYVQHHQPPKITEPSLKITTTIKKEAGETGPKT